MKNSVKILPVLVLLCTPFHLIGQSNERSTVQMERIPVDQINYDSLDVIPGQFPLYYFPEGTDTAEQIKVTGKVLEVSSPGFYCGAFCQSGTAKIEVITSTDKVYAEKIIYVLIGCFMPEKDMVGKKVEFLINRMTDKTHIGCYKESCYNSINSGGKPFYYCINYW